jgi:hypothetical protein
MLLQKSYIKDYLSKKQVRNDGVLPKYYIKNNHEPIIDREVFEKVQNEIKRRSKKSSKIKRKHLFTGLIKCSICGSLYKHKTNNSGTKYAKSVWICNTFNSLGKSHCASKQIPENILKDITAEVLGLTNFDEKDLKQIIKMIEISGNRSLNFIFKDGKHVKKNWDYKSQSESWIPEMKEKARETALCKEQHRK